MAINTKIEWCDMTANLWHGCTKVHEGCDHCYAETMSKRWKRDIWGNDKPRMIINSVWNDLRKAQELAANAGEMQRVFVGSMMDIFEKPMPVINSKVDLLSGVQTEVGFIGDLKNDDAQLTTGHLRDKLFEQISAGKYPNLIFLFLTKRPSNINKYIPESWKRNPPANVMFGTSPVNQATADKLIPQLLQVNAKRFLSIEPMLGNINLGFLGTAPKSWGLGYVPIHNLIHWVICGGESGHGARPMHPAWVRSIRDQCSEANVPFFFKQWGEYKHSGGSLTKPGVFDHNQIALADPVPGFENNCVIMKKVGKKEAGSLLDGKEHHEFPDRLFFGTNLLRKVNH